MGIHYLHCYYTLIVHINPYTPRVLRYTPMLHCYYTPNKSNITLLLYPYYTPSKSNITLLLQYYYSHVIMPHVTLHPCHTIMTPVLHPCYTVITNILHCYKTNIKPMYIMPYLQCNDHGNDIHFTHGQSLSPRIQKPFNNLYSI